MSLNSVRIYVFDHFEAAENARKQLLAVGLPGEGIELDASAHQPGPLAGAVTNVYQLRVTGVPDQRAALVVSIAVRCGGTDIGDLTPPDS